MPAMGEGGIRGGDRSDTRRPLMVAQAADALGVTVDAIRSRIKRNTIEHVRKDGRVYVILGDDQGATSTDQGIDQGDDQDADGGGEHERVRADPRDELIEELRDRVRSLEQANRENRRIIAGLTQRIPEIESPEPREAPETVTGGPTKGAPMEQPYTQEKEGEGGERSWWRRFFGIE
jgi:hypothetical protein